MAYKGENVKIRRKQGGSVLELASGAFLNILSGAKITLVGADGIQVKASGEISVKSTGSVDFLSGALIEFAGVDYRARLVATVLNPLAGIAASYKLARGIFSPTSGSADVVTGLTTVVAAVATLVATPTVSHMWSQATIGNQSGSPAAGSITIISRKPTAVDNVAPADATTPWVDVAWIAIGT